MNRGAFYPSFPSPTIPTKDTSLHKIPALFSKWEFITEQWHGHNIRFQDKVWIQYKGE